MEPPPQHNSSNWGFRQYVACTYIAFNIIGFAVNTWVMYVVAPLLFAPAVKVPRSIIFYILSLCMADLVAMISMLLLVIDLVLGTWPFSSFTCTAYLVIDSMNKFVAPIIVVLISRTCYATICLEKKAGERAAQLKWAVLQVIASLTVVMLLMWPVFFYSNVFSIPISPNNETRTVIVMTKCVFAPPSGVELYFNLTSCVFSYAIPLFGILYWYVSVPFFLKRRALTTLVASSSSDSAIRKVVTTVLLLTAIYIVCWSPYWATMFAHRIWNLNHFGQKSLIIIGYLVHLLPYVSCIAYPLIFTVMNRGIKAAHAKIVEDQRRRFRSITDEASSHIRTAKHAICNSLPSKVSSTLNFPRGSFLEISTANNPAPSLLSSRSAIDLRKNSASDAEPLPSRQFLTPTLNGGGSHVTWSDNEHATTVSISGDAATVSVGKKELVVESQTDKENSESETLL